MNIADFKTWRKQELERDLSSADKLIGARGPYVTLERIKIEDTVQPDLHLKNRAIEDAEFELVFNSKDPSPEMREKLYGNDDALYEAYKSLHIASFANVKRRESRNNVIVRKECCLCYWQLFCDELIVVSRSWDIQRAGLSDVVIVNRIAHELGCKRFSIYTLNNHIYENRDTVARRT